MSKTLGQIRSDAFNEAFANQTDWSAAEAASMAAVARHVVAEALAAHVAECHRLKPRTVNLDDDQPGPNAWASRPWEMSEQPVGQKQPEAGDWVKKVVDSGWRTGCELEDKIREAAERHYSRLGSVEHAKRLADRLDASRERIKQLDECVANVVKERDDAMDDLNKFSGTIASLTKRAEAAESALAEIREAMAWSSLDSSITAWSLTSQKWEVWSCGKTLAMNDKKIDAILAAYRVHKAASVAAEGAVKL